MKKLRQVLSDDADHPRYVETLPRRGYRFIGQINVDAFEAELVADQFWRGAVGSESQAAPATPTRRFWKWYIALPIGIGLAVLLVAGALFVRSRRVHVLTERDTIVLADFVNTTGDPVFDDALKQALFVQLAQSPFLNILPEQEVRKTLGLMGHTAKEPITPADAWEVCQRIGSKALIGGSIATLGSEYVIGLNALNCRTGESLAHEQVQVARKEDVLNALGKAATDLRKRLGESLASIEKFDTPIEEATTPSLEALKAFTLGSKIMLTQGSQAAIPFLKRAIELDPNFALAYVRLGFAASNLGEEKESLAYAKKAYELRDRVSEKEKLGILAAYYMNATGDLEKLAEVVDIRQKTFPPDPRWHNISGIVFSHFGQYEKALHEYQEAVRAYPDDALDSYNVAISFMALNRFDESRGAVEAAWNHGAEDYHLHYALYLLGFLNSDRAEMERQLAWAAGRPDADHVMFAAHSDTEAFYGRQARARDYSRRAVEAAVRRGAKESAARWRAYDALRDAEFGNNLRAEMSIRNALADLPSRDLKVLAALTLARVGKLPQSEDLIEELAGTFPSGTMMQSYLLHTVRAAVAIHRDQPGQAIEILQASSPYELGSTTPALVLYPVYLRGEAFQKNGQGPQAAAEYEKLIAHSGIVGNFPIASLARLGLARSYAMQGDISKARAAYQDFLTLWKDADPDVPILKQAKAEYEKLQVANPSR